MKQSRLVLAASILLAAVFLAAVALPEQRGDGTYYTASRLLLRGQFGPEVYDNAWMGGQVEAATAGRLRDIFRPNPPTAALLALPVAWLPPPAARRAWAALNTLLLFGALALLGAGTRSPAVSRRGRGAGAVAWLLALAFSLFAAPVVEGFQLGQAYILLLALYALAWWGLRARRASVAGLSLALAMMLKTSGGPLWLLLLARREWRALGWAALGCVALFGLSLPGVGLDTWRAYLTDVLPTAAASPTVTVTAFQSLPGLWAHLFRFDPQWNPAPLANLPGLASLLSMASVLAVVGLTALVARRASLNTAFAALAAASVFVVPFAEQHHYTLIALPVVLAAASWRTDSETRFLQETGFLDLLFIGALLFIALLLMALPLPYESPAYAFGWRALLAYPRLYGGLLVWGVLLRLALRPAARPSEAGA